MCASEGWGGRVILAQVWHEQHFRDAGLCPHRPDWYEGELLRFWRAVRGSLSIFPNFQHLFQPVVAAACRSCQGKMGNNSSQSIYRNISHLWIQYWWIRVMQNNFVCVLPFRVGWRVSLRVLGCVKRKRNCFETAISAFLASLMAVPNGIQRVPLSPRWQPERAERRRRRWRRKRERDWAGGERKSERRVILPRLSLITTGMSLALRPGGSLPETRQRFPAKAAVVAAAAGPAVIYGRHKRWY